MFLTEILVKSQYDTHNFPGEKTTVKLLTSLGKQRDILRWMAGTSCKTPWYCVFPNHTLCSLPKSFYTCNNFAKSSLDNILWSISSSTVTLDKCFYASPTPCQRRFQNRFRAFFALIFFLMPGRLVHGDAIFWFMQSTVWEGYRRNTQTLEKHHWGYRTVVLLWRAAWKGLGRQLRGWARTPNIGDSIGAH